MLIFKFKKIYNHLQFEEDATILKFWIVQIERFIHMARNQKHENLQVINVVGIKVDNELIVSQMDK